MDFTGEELIIIQNMVGTLEENKTAVMKERIDCFLHPKVSLFIPASGQCKYATTPRHTHPAYAFIYYFQAVRDLIIEEKSYSYELSNGKCLVAISPDIQHQETETQDFQSYIAIMIEKDFFQSILKKYGLSDEVFKGEIFAPNPELLAFLRCFMVEADEKGNRSEELLENLASAIAYLTAQSIRPKSYESVHLYERFEVDRAITYMNQHYNRKISVEELAAHVSISTSHFSKTFKAVTGNTPLDFLNNMRLKKARDMMLLNNKTLTEIALACGFGSSAYFSSCFTERYQMTPSAYRLKFHPQNRKQDSDKSSQNFESGRE